MKWYHLLIVALLVLCGSLLGVVVAAPNEPAPPADAEVLFAGEVVFLTVQTKDKLHLMSATDLNASSILHVTSKEASPDTTIYLQVGPTWSSVERQRGDQKDLWFVRSERIVEYQPK